MMQIHFGGALGNKFDDPFLLPSSDYIPDNLKSSLDFCLFLYYLNSKYRQAATRVVSHFITPFDFPGDVGSKSEKSDLDDYLTYDLRLPQKMSEVGAEYSCYGNAFVRIYFPFDRVLIDKERGATYSLDLYQDVAKFHLKELKYEIPDPQEPRKKIKLSFRDIYVRDKGRIKIRLLDPRDVVIQHNFVSGNNSFIWKFPSELKKGCADGKLHVVNDIPLDMLRAMRDDQDFQFFEDEVFHFRAPTISGVSNRGWGLPDTLANYRDLHNLQVYRKIDEAIGLDYMVPFRIFSPELSTSESSQIRNVVMSNWKTEIQRIVANRRKDKFAIHALPFPVKYDEHGANGKELTPKDLLEYQTNSMLDGMGYPAELFTGSLQVQQVPTAVRLFENSHMFIHFGFSDLLQWVVKKISKFMGEQEIRAKMTRPALADNLDRQNVRLQLSSAGEISRKSAYGFLGIDDPVEEKKKRLEEDAEIQKEQIAVEQEVRQQMESGTINQQLDAQAEAAQQQQAGGSLPGGDPSGGGGQVTPMDIQGQAEQLAQQWAQMPQGDRSKHMQQVKAQDNQLYALAKEALEEMRSSAKSQGLQQFNAQAQGQSPQ